MNELKILVVDDESRMRKLVKDFLTRAGYQVLEAQDGEEAVDTFYSTKGINLLVLDVMMPKMDGWEVVKEIRKVSKVPIIMLTAKDQEQDELLGFELGVDEYISKPFSPKILVARAEAILRRTVQTEGEQIEAGGIVMEMCIRDRCKNDRNAKYITSSINISRSFFLSSDLRKCDLKSLKTDSKPKEINRKDQLINSNLDVYKRQVLLV